MAARLQRRRRLALAGLIALVLLAALPVLTYPLGRDQGEFATIGRGLLNGRVPYVDLWNPKPPAVFYVYAAAMAAFGQTAPALRAIDLLLYPPVALALYGIGRRLGGPRTGLWAALLFGVFYFTETFWTLTQNDGIALLPMTLAVYAALRAAEAGPRAALWALAAGALVAWALWFKYPFILFVPVVAAAYWFRRPPERRRVAQSIGAFAAGGLLVGLGGAAYLAALGALDALIESAVVTAQYTALGLNESDPGASVAAVLGFRWAQWGLLFVLAALWPLARRYTRTRAGWLPWLWLAAGLGIMLVQAKGYDYHWLPALPPLALLAATSIDGLLNRLAKFGHVPAALWRLVAAGMALLVLVWGVWGKALPYLTGRETEAEYAARFQAGEFVAAESLAVAEYLRQRAAPGDSLFIWGFRPEVYYLSRLYPASRFIFQFPLVADWYPAAWREETVDILWAAMPPYALVLQVDYMPWVTGRDADSNTLLQEYTELNNWLIANYERETQIGNFFIWRRKQ